MQLHSMHDFDFASHTQFTLKSDSVQQKEARAAPVLFALPQR